METEFGVKEKKTALLLCQAEETTAGSCPKDCARLRERTGGAFRVWGEKIGAQTRAGWMQALLPLRVGVSWPQDWFRGSSTLVVTCWGLRSAEGLRLLCVFLEGDPGLGPGAALLPLDWSPVSASPPFPDEQQFEPALWELRGGHGG